MKGLLSIMFLALASQSAFADCDCLITPFPRSCAKECMAKVLAKAHYTDLNGTLGLSSSTSMKILEVPERDKLKSIDEYARVLNKQQLAEVQQKLSNIDTRAVASIFGSDEPRRKMPAKK